MLKHISSPGDIEMEKLTVRGELLCAIKVIWFLFLYQGQANNVANAQHREEDLQHPNLPNVSFVIIA